MKLVIAAGGTGGHLFPGLAVGEAMLARGHQVMILISEKEIDSLATQGRTEFRIERVPGMGLPRLFSPAVFGFLRRFMAGLRRCHELYRDFQPNAVLGMGGFTSTAPILAGRKRKTPTFVHESNAIPGKANRLNGWLADCVLLGFEECRRYFPKAHCEVTGTPVRATLAEKLPKEKALALFHLVPGRRTLLIMGGSQGAHGLNQAIAAALPSLKDLVQVIHLSGAQDEEMLREAYQRAGIPAFVAAFHHRMEEAYSAADLAVARSGAASLTELSHFAIPSVLLPYPFAAEDHQTLNARIFEQAGAAILLPEHEATPEVLAAKLRWLLDDPARLSEMSERSAKLAPQGAAERVAETILRFCP
jgi:UDP-N-acetylglucosamine--N-acetylmuramyl-(pentapeptide) pyrophosphoryl-undecaprenol N-acetylglucosamine transferase